MSGSASDIAVSSAEVTITDNDTATLSITGPSELEEGDEDHYQDELSNELADQIHVAFEVRAGSADDSDYEYDYWVDREGFLLFGSAWQGSSHISGTSVQIIVHDDDFSENAETLSVVLGEITGDLARRISIKTGEGSVSTTIAASDPITVSLSGPAVAHEGSETADYTVSLSGGVPTADLTVDYATADGTAEAGSDYTAKSGTLTFTSDDHDNKTFTVQTTEDSVEDTRRGPSPCRFPTRLAVAVADDPRSGYFIGDHDDRGSRAYRPERGYRLRWPKDASATDIVTVTATLDEAALLLSSDTHRLTVSS